VTVVGELDPLGAPDLAAVLDALIDRGHQRITIDATELGFIDASGLGVFAAARARLLRSDGEIRILGLSDLSYRVFEITGLVDALHVEPRSAGPRSGLRSETGQLASQVSRLAAESARSDALLATLSRLTALIPQIVGACDGVSVTLRHRDHLITAAASDETVRELDHAQYSDHEGPCLDAANGGAQVHAEALADESRWPSFVPRARDRGIESILSSPLVVDHRPTGALNLYSRTVSAFPVVEQELANLLAAQTSLVLDETGPPTAHGFDRSIDDALSSRDVIAQAQGVLMERLGLGAEDAYLALRRESVRTSVPLRNRADEIVAQTQPGDARADAEEASGE
jgi:anti-anti-sigma factor